MNAFGLSSARRKRQHASRARLALATLLALLIAGPVFLSYYLMKANGSPRPTLQLATVRMVNYYPSRGGWEYLWTRFDPAAIDRDMRRARALGANTVRVFLLPSALGYPQPRAVMLDRLERLLQIAGSHDLRLGLALFDGFHRYRDVEGSEEWAGAVLAGHESDPRVAFVEAQNEINPDDPVAMRWLRQIIPFVRARAPRMAVTVSAPGTGGGARLALLVHALGSHRPDFYDFHYFGGAEWAASAFASAQRAAGSVPLLVGETGYSTTAGNLRAVGVEPEAAAQEDWQAHYYRTVQYAARQLGLPPAAPWALDDFVPGAIPSRMRLSQNPEQYRYGLFRADGRPKPAAAVVRRAFVDGQIEPSFHNGFEDALATPHGLLPLGWRIWDQGDAQFAWDGAVSHSGLASARISQSHGSAGSVPAFFSSPIDDAVVPGALYSVSVWARGQDATGDNHVALAWYDAAHHYLGQTRSEPLPAGTSGWMLLHASGRPPAGASSYQVHLKSFENSGTVWFDDVSLG